MLSLEAQIEQKKKANKIIRFRTLLVAGFGFIPFPVVDAAGILAIQLWMLRDLAKLYNIPFKKQLAQSIIGSLAGNISSVGAFKLIPGLGSLLGGGAVALSGAAATYALGKIFTQHFDQGGTLLTFDPIKSRAYFQQLYEEGKASVKELSEQEAGFKEVHTQAIASVGTLKQTNEELKNTIASLQHQLEQGKKDRKFAVAALQEKKRKRFRWLWLALILILVTIIVGWLFLAGHINPVRYFTKAGGEKTEAGVAADQGAAPNEGTAAAIAEVDSTVAQNAPDTSAAILAGPTAAELDFTSGSTEAEMADYMSAVDAGFPKTFTLGAVQFAEGMAALEAAAEQQLANIATLLQNYPAAKLRIYGHTDQNNGKAANRQAGRNRARVIQEALEQHGVERKNISASYREKTAPPDGMRGAEIEIISR